MNDPQDQHSSALGHEFEAEEYYPQLPLANVARIMKHALPEEAKISKEAKECMQECVGEFISFITSEAAEKCHREKRSIIKNEDILLAMFSLGFENYAEALKSQCNYRGHQQGRVGSHGLDAARNADAAGVGFQLRELVILEDAVRSCGEEESIHDDGLAAVM